jgi:hypothetical protein
MRRPRRTAFRSVADRPVLRYPVRSRDDDPKESGFSLSTAIYFSFVTLATL